MSWPSPPSTSRTSTRAIRPQKFARLAEIIVDPLAAPDLVVLEEVQDNSGTRDDGVVAADATAAQLIAAIASAGGPVYDYRDVPPGNDQDGGQEGGNIRVGFLFRTDRGLAFVDRPGGTATTPVTVQPGPRPLGQSRDASCPIPPTRRMPRPLTARASRWSGSSPTTGSGSSSSATTSPPAWAVPPSMGGRSLRRRAARPSARCKRRSWRALSRTCSRPIRMPWSWCWGTSTTSSSRQPVATLEAAGLTDLFATLPEAERYSYVFQGNSQTLDHMLVSAALQSALVPGSFDVVHVNAEFADQASDHDPQVARFLLPAA